MRVLILGLFLGWAATASAGELSAKTVRLDLPLDEAMLIVAALGQIGGCDKVSGMATCELARQTIKDIQAAAKTQGN